MKRDCGYSAIRNQKQGGCYENEDIGYNSRENSGPLFPTVHNSGIAGQDAGRMPERYANNEMRMAELKSQNN
jgi:hypothetical protein